MAEIVLDDIVEKLIANVFSLATKHISFEQGFKEELRGLLETLFKINFVLHDAQKRQVIDESMRNYLMELRDVV